MQTNKVRSHGVILQYDISGHLLRQFNIQVCHHFHLQSIAQNILRIQFDLQEFYSINYIERTNYLKVFMRKFIDSHHVVHLHRILFYFQCINSVQGNRPIGKS